MNYIQLKGNNYLSLTTFFRIKKQSNESVYRNEPEPVGSVFK